MRVCAGSLKSVVVIWCAWRRRLCVGVCSHACVFHACVTPHRDEDGVGPAPPPADMDADDAYGAYPEPEDVQEGAVVQYGEEEAVPEEVRGSILLCLLCSWDTFKVGARTHVMWGWVSGEI